MTTAKNRARRIAAVGAFAVAAAAVPVLAALGSSTTSTSTATGDCLAWVGSRDDGQCIGHSNGNPTYIGTPQFGYFGPDTGNPGMGIMTGPLLPGQTISVPLG